MGNESNDDTAGLRTPRGPAPGWRESSFSFRRAKPPERQRSKPAGRPGGVQNGTRPIPIPNEFHQKVRLKALFILPAVATGIWLIAAPRGEKSTPHQPVQTAILPPSLGVPKKQPAAHRPNLLTPLVSSSLSSIAAESDDEKRLQNLDTFISGISPDDIQLTLDALRDLPQNDTTTQAISSLLRRWTTLDSPAAALWAERLPSGPPRDQGLADVAIQWANTDLAGSSAWAERLQDPAEHHSAVLAIAAEAIRSEPSESLRLAMNTPATPQRDQLVTHAAMELACTDGPAAAAWARQIPDEALRQSTLAAIATAWSDSDPIAAATLASLEIPEGRPQSDAVISIIQRWAQTQPVPASNWASQFGPGELRQTAFDCLRALGETELRNDTAIPGE